MLTALLQLFVIRRGFERPPATVEEEEEMLHRKDKGEGESAGSFHEGRSHSRMGIR